MYSTQKRCVTLGVVVLLIFSVVATAGVVTAEPEDLTFEQEFEGDQLLATDEQTLQFTVTNEDDAPFDQPIIEIVDSGQIDIDETSAVVIDSDNNEEDRTTDTLSESESVSGDDAVIIEGEPGEIPGGETVTFEIDIEVLTAGDIEIETLVYPLLQEPSDTSEVETRDDSDIDTLEVEAFQPGTLDVTIEDGDEDDIFVDGESVATDSYTEEVAAEGSGGDPVTYDIAAEIPLADGEQVTLEDVTVPAITPDRTVEFFPEDEATEPTVVAQTEDVDIVGLSDPIKQGNAEDPFEQEFSFDLDTDGGTFVIGVDDPSSLDPFNSVDSDIDTGEISTDDSPEESTLTTIDTDDDAVVSITYEGFPLGDVTATGDVTNSDATTIAQSLAAGDDDELNQLYADVTDDGEITAADAMFIAQYDGGDGPRNEDYDLNGGS